MLTVVVVDDIVALVVIATVYTEDAASSRSRSRSPSSPRCWCAARSGVRVGSCTPPRSGGLGGAARVGRGAGRGRAGDGLLDLRVPGPRSTSSARPSGSASSASSRPPSSRARPDAGLRSAMSPNERLQQLFHPWTSYVIVPLFALANAGIAIDGAFLARAFSSPITLGILFGYVVGKPVGILGRVLARHAAEPRAAAAARRLGGRRRRRHDRRHRVHGLAADRDARLRRLGLEEAKLGILSAALGAALLTWLLFRRRRCFRGGCASAPCSEQRSRSSTSTSTSIPSATTFAGRDAPVTVVEYGDFECPVLRAGRAGRARAAAGVRRYPLRLAAPAAQRRPPARPARRRGGRGGRRRRARSGRCTTFCSNTRTRCARETWSLTPSSWASTPNASPRPARHAGAGASRRTSTGPT